MAIAMETQLMWENPPAPNLGKAGAIALQTDTIVRELKQNRGKWARVEEGGPHLASKYKRRGCEVRTVKNQYDDTFSIYARWA